MAYSRQQDRRRRDSGSSYRNDQNHRRPIRNGKDGPPSNSRTNDRCYRYNHNLPSRPRSRSPSLQRQRRQHTSSYVQSHSYARPHKTFDDSLNSIYLQRGENLEGRKRGRDDDHHIADATHGKRQRNDQDRNTQGSFYRSTISDSRTWHPVIERARYTILKDRRLNEAQLLYDGNSKRGSNAHPSPWVIEI